MWGLAPPLARASNEWFLSQIFQAELSLRLEAAGSLPSLAASAAGDTFSILLEVSVHRLAQACESKPLHGLFTKQNFCCSLFWQC